MAGVFAASPASAGVNVGTTYVRNSDNTNTYILKISPTTGSHYWSGLASGYTSSYGVAGTEVPYHGRILFKILHSGELRWSDCGYNYYKRGYANSGNAYLPLGTTSIEILDINFTACP